VVCGIQADQLNALHALRGRREAIGEEERERRTQKRKIILCSQAAPARRMLPE